MYVQHALQQQDDSPHEDHVIILQDINWTQFTNLLEAKGDKPIPRLTYLDGQLELMSPSVDHEKIKSMIGRLLEAYCLEKNISFSPYGSWTITSPHNKRAVEPDECYILGETLQDQPHLAIEVFWTSGRIDKLDVYRKLKVEEVWIWNKGRIAIYCLDDEQYAHENRSRLFPDLDLDWLVSFMARPTVFDAVKALGADLKSRRT